MLSQVNQLENKKRENRKARFQSAICKRVEKSYSRSINETKKTNLQLRNKTFVWLKIWYMYKISNV